jgi:hypothetical protein
MNDIQSKPIKKTSHTSSYFNKGNKAQDRTGIPHSHIDLPGPAPAKRKRHQELETEDDGSEWIRHKRAEKPSRAEKSWHHYVSHRPGASYRLLTSYVRARAIRDTIKHREEEGVRVRKGDETEKSVKRLGWGSGEGGGRDSWANSKLRESEREWEWE